MVKENAIIQLGIKGADLIISTFKKINLQKDKLEKSTNVNLNPNGSSAESGKIDQTVRTLSGAFQDLTKSALSLNSAQILNSTIGAAGKATGLIPGLSSISEAASELAQAGVNAAQGSLNAIKGAQSIAIDTLKQESRNKFYGGANIFDKNTILTLSEQTSLLSSTVGRFGRIGNNFGTAIKRLLDEGVEVNQAQQLAAGQFSALGTNEGFFLQKISDSFSGLPPELAQELNAQILNGIKTSETARESEQSKNFRKLNKAFDDADREAQKGIAGLGNKSTIDLNAQFNALNKTLVETGSKLQDTVATFGGAVNKVLLELPTLIAKAGVAANVVGAVFNPIGSIAESSRKGVKGR